MLIWAQPRGTGHSGMFDVSGAKEQLKGGFIRRENGFGLVGISKTFGGCPDIADVIDAARAILQVVSGINAVIVEGMANIVIPVS